MVKISELITVWERALSPVSDQGKSPRYWFLRSQNQKNCASFAVAPAKLSFYVSACESMRVVLCGIFTYRLIVNLHFAVLSSSCLQN